MLRPIPAPLLPVALLAAGCSAAGPGCPGQPVATLQFQAALAGSSCGGAPSAAYANQLPASFAFSATLAYAAQGSAAALCTGRVDSSPLVGTRSGDAISVLVDTSQAALAGCSSTCAVSVEQLVTGTLSRDAAGTPTGFTGTLVETDTAAPGADCAPCTSPCQATWTLAATP